MEDSEKNNLKKYLFEEKRIDLKYFKVSIGDFILFLVNLLVFPAMFFQMRKTFRTKESEDFNPFFVALQLVGGAPEGMVGAILGKMDNNIQQVCIGVYAMFYNIFMLFFRFFGKNGLIMPLW